MRSPLSKTSTLKLSLDGYFQGYFPLSDREPRDVSVSGLLFQFGRLRSHGSVLLLFREDPGGAPRLGRPTVSAVADVPTAAAVGLLGLALEFFAELKGHSVGLLQCCYKLAMAFLHHFV